MGLEELIGNIYGQNMQQPLQYGNMYQNAYNPYFQYLGSQAGNQASMGNQYMGNMGQLGQGQMNLYGNLAGQQTSMYQSELPFQMQQQQFNSLAPVLSGLLGQGGFNLPSITPISMSFNRPDVMSGYQGAVNQAYGAQRDAYGQASNNARSYDSYMGGAFADMMDKMPRAPYMSPSPAAPQYGKTPFVGERSGEQEDAVQQNMRMSRGLSPVAPGRSVQDQAVFANQIRNNALAASGANYRQGRWRS